MRDYDALRRHLSQLAQAPGDTLRVPFALLDELVGGLPPSARKHRAWWSNNGHQARAWRDAGWLVAKVVPSTGEVLFRRASSITGETRASRGARAPSPRHPAARRKAAALLDPGGAPVGITDVRVTLEWRDVGEISLDGDGHVRFPRLPALPGLYRMTFLRDGARPRIYIGETDGLQRRFRHYRLPASTQTTNVRLNKALKEHLGKALSARLAVAAQATVEIRPGGAPRMLDLARKASRLLAENAALVAAHQAGNAEIENLE